MSFALDDLDFAPLASISCFSFQYRIGDGQMPRDAKPKKPPSRSGPRTSRGKKQMLVIMDAGIKDKVAMAEDGTAASHLVEELVWDWLATREVRK